MSILFLAYCIKQLTALTSSQPEARPENGGANQKSDIRCPDSYYRDSTGDKGESSGQKEQEKEKGGGQRDSETGGGVITAVFTTERFNCPWTLVVHVVECRGVTPDAKAQFAVLPSLSLAAKLFHYQARPGALPLLWRTSDCAERAVEFARER